jgi:hypothetical protein
LSAVSASDFDLYLLLGQSNMEGYGDTSEIANRPEIAESDAMIFHGNDARDGVIADGRGVWARLKPGHGVGFSSDGNENRYSTRFGIELSFASRMQKQRPSRRIAIVKYARGGTSLGTTGRRSKGSWLPTANTRYRRGGVNQFGHAMKALEQATAVRDIDRDGIDDALFPAAVIWLQGERDATAPHHVAARYEKNLRELATAIRRHTGESSLPFIVAAIADSGRDSGTAVMAYADLVQSAQAGFVRADSMATLVRLEHYDFIDRYHFDAGTLAVLGDEIARAALPLLLLNQDIAR